MHKTNTMERPIVTVNSGASSTQYTQFFFSIHIFTYEGMWEHKVCGHRSTNQLRDGNNMVCVAIKY